MTVQELINKLNKVENKELPVLLQSTDHTDFTYVLDFNEDDIYVGEDVHDDNGYGEDKGLVIRVDF
jgi:hypothetical protein